MSILATLAAAKAPAKTWNYLGTVSSPDKQAMVVKFRPLVSRLHPGDPLRFGLRFSGELASFDASIPPFNQRFNWFDLFESLQIEISRAAGGHQIITLQPLVQNKKRRYGTVHSPTIFCELDDTSFTLLRPGSKRRQKFSYRQKSKFSLQAAGKYTIRIRGKFKFAGVPQPLAFATEPLQFERVAQFLPLAKIEAIALAEVKSAKLHSKHWISEDDRGNRRVVLWFKAKRGRNLPRRPKGRSRRNQPRWKHTSVLHYLTISPAGKVLKKEKKSYYTCVAKGTPVATQLGQRPVETIRPGDLVWSCELPARRPVLAEVQYVYRSDAARDAPYWRCSAGDGGTPDLRRRGLAGGRGHFALGSAPAVRLETANGRTDQSRCRVDRCL